MVVPLLALLIFGGMKMAMLYRAYNVVSNATMVGLRFAAPVGGTSGIAVQGIRDALSGGGLDPEAAAISVTRDARGTLPAEANSSPAPWGEPLYVAVRYSYRLSIPFVGEREVVLERRMVGRSERGY